MDGGLSQRCRSCRARKEDAEGFLRGDTVGVCVAARVVVVDFIAGVPEVRDTAKGDRLRPGGGKRCIDGIEGPVGARGGAVP